MPEIAIPPSARDLVAGLPRTFGPSFNDQLSQWDLLFPAEQRQLQAQMDWLARLPAGEFKRLFAPVVEIESRMDLPRWDPHTRGMSVTDTGILARSPYYAQWRSEVEEVFRQIDEGVGASGRLKPVQRLVACILPSGVPVSKDPLWPELAKQGTWVALRAPFGAVFPQWVSAVAGRKRPEGLEDFESTWILECESRFSALSASPATTLLSWADLAAVRREFLDRLNTIRRDLRSLDETHDELRRFNITRLLDRSIGERPRVREFVRTLLLSGNGSLVFPNSFVQWGASEALRRAQPQVLLACFGLRQKLKPFSSTVLFEDQARRNPTADEDDPAGSLVDDVILSQYVYLAAQRVTAYQSHTLTMFAGGDLDRVLLLGAKRPPAGGLAPEQLTAFTVEWLESKG